MEQNQVNREIVTVHTALQKEYLNHLRWKYGHTTQLEIFL